MENHMKEIGGYIEFEKYHGTKFHDRAIALNCGRNCLLYLICAKKIKKIKIPYFLCDSVRKLCALEDVFVSYYRINEDFTPEKISLEDDEWLYVVNYYGQLSQDFIKILKGKYERVIIDNAQAYFQMPIESVDTLYTCRKYLGVADGAFLYTDVFLDKELEMDFSYDRMNFLLGRFEKTASEFYSEYVANNHLFAREPLKQMSKLTSNLLATIDYEAVKEQRTKNFAYLHKVLGHMNKLNLVIPEGAFMYPFFHEDAVEIRKELQQKRIYIPTLWPNVLEDVEESDLEYRYTQNVLPLPCDQRYNVEDMKYLVEEILKCIN